MVKELHGKVYYIELRDYQEVVTVQKIKNESFSLKDEFFVLKKRDENSWILYSEAPTGSFRGSKYREWEKLKATIYKLRKEVEEEMRRSQQ